MAWVMRNGEIVNTENELWLTGPALKKPYPAGLWRIENGVLTTGLLPETAEMGAFCHCSKLGRVSIPESVKKIGPYAFRNTALKRVKISADCEYYDTSFPDRCEVSFYDYETNFETDDEEEFITSDNRIFEAQEE